MRVLRRLSYFFACGFVNATFFKSDLLFRKRIRYELCNKLTQIPLTQLAGTKVYKTDVPIIFVRLFYIFQMIIIFRENNHING